jgi:hypothetical protein
MNVHEMTGTELRTAAFGAIRRELGPDGLVRFIAQNFSQPGRDYTAERQERPQPTLEEIVAEVERMKAERGGSLAPSGARIIAEDEGEMDLRQERKK